MTIILSIVAPAGIPLTESVLLTPGELLSVIARFMVPDENDKLPFILPPVVDSNSGGLLVHRTALAGEIDTAVGEAFIVTTVVAGSEVHPSVDVAVNVYVPECDKISPDLVGF